MQGQSRQSAYRGGQWVYLLFRVERVFDHRNLLLDHQKVVSEKDLRIGLAFGELLQEFGFLPNQRTIQPERCYS